MKKLSLDETFEWYTAQIRRMHDALNLHEWIKDHRPWLRNDEFHLQCRCGAGRPASSPSEFKEAQEDYAGY